MLDLVRHIQATQPHPTHLQVHLARSRTRVHTIDIQLGAHVFNYCTATLKAFLVTFVLKIRPTRCI